MKVSFMGTTMKQNNSHPSGSVHLHPSRRRCGRQRSSVKSVLIFFFGIVGIIHKQFVSPCSTVNAKFYWGVLRRLREDMWGKQRDKWHMKNWVLHHDMHQHTPIWLCSGFWPPKTWLSPHTHLLAWFRPLWLRSLTQNENHVERTKIWHHGGDAGQIAEAAEDTDTKGLRGQHAIMTETLGSLCMFPRWLLGRGL